MPSYRHIPPKTFKNRRYDLQLSAIKCSTARARREGMRRTYRRDENDEKEERIEKEEKDQRDEKYERHRRYTPIDKTAREGTAG